MTKVPRELSQEDQNRVDEYLNSPIHQVERRAFSPFKLLGILLVIVSAISLSSLLMARLHGVI